ncbi:MAG: glycerol-3-phosphate 1-O-acyltransferase PlsY [Thermodesulfobacteriota bacterium]|nr:glycerol-3-phosphate 1-O-acyltransferase PlsY [Thermodesulfobacteriota bacterium]
MEPIEIAIYFFIPALAYAIGAIPFGLILAKRFSNTDVRQAGSGNIGATNVSRVAGKKLGAITLVCDILKGGGPVFLAGMVPSGNPATAMAMAGMAAFLGHLYPVYSGFKGGGKGVATACGCFLVAAPYACMAALGVFVAAVLIFRRVSAGSLLAALSLPVAVWLFYAAGPILVFAMAVALLVMIRHRTNIKRLISGREPPFF